ncbi:UNVERIFIED_CONTAM: hypothetical protein K2H54_015696 [Gekko kuhli]
MSQVAQEWTLASHAHQACTAANLAWPCRKDPAIQDIIVSRDPVLPPRLDCPLAAFALQGITAPGAQRNRGQCPAQQERGMSRKALETLAGACLVRLDSSAMVQAAFPQRDAVLQVRGNDGFKTTD